MAVAIQDKNQFILEASKLAMHALLSCPRGRTTPSPEGIANEAKKYAVALWRTMRVEV